MADGQTLKIASSSAAGSGRVTSAARMTIESGVALLHLAQQLSQADRFGVDDGAQLDGSGELPLHPLRARHELRRRFERAHGKRHQPFADGTQCHAGSGAFEERGKESHPMMEMSLYGQRTRGERHARSKTAAIP